MEQKAAVAKFTADSNARIESIKVMWRQKVRKYQKIQTDGAYYIRGFF